MRGAALRAQLSPCRDVVDAVERTGFLRTLGGVEAYVALHARVPGFRARDAETAIEERRLCVVPAVRGCVYVVARKDVPHALRIAHLLARKNADRTNAKAGIKKGEIEKLAAEVSAALAKGPLSTDGIKKALPENAVRSLGEKGKKAGISSTLPPTLNWMEWTGGIERTPEGGRLDTQKYVWRPAKTKPLALSIAELAPRLAEIFLRGAAFGTAKDFACWAGISQRDAKAALGETGAATELGYTLGKIDVRSESDACALLPFEDNLLAYHGGPALFTDARFHSLQVPQWGSSGKGPLVGARHLAYRPIIGDEKLVGFWEYDPKPREIALGYFDAVSPSAKARIEEQAHALGRLLADEVGHGRSFSLDTDEECAKRAAWVRKLKPPAANKRPSRDSVRA